MWLYHWETHPKDVAEIANNVYPLGAVWSGSTLVTQTCLSKNSGSLRYFTVPRMAGATFHMKCQCHNVRSFNSKILKLITVHLHFWPQSMHLVSTHPTESPYWHCRTSTQLWGIYGPGGASQLTVECRNSQNLLFFLQSKISNEPPNDKSNNVLNG